MKKNKKVMLIIRDGWGYGEKNKGNAIAAAKTPNHDHFVRNYPTAILKCTGNDVGNPPGIQGGSEVGHVTMGAGRIVWQPYEFINKKIENGEFFTNLKFKEIIQHCKKQGTNLHIDGLFSTEGVHADYRHLLVLLECAKRMDFNRVFVHLTLDGRDMPERSFLKLYDEFESKMKEIGVGEVASVVGRYYAMDRDQNWDRTIKAYDLLVQGHGFKAKDARDAVKQGYARGENTDYYIKPTIILKEGKPVSLLGDNDAFVWYNFRSDRSRQISAMIGGLPYCPINPNKKVKVKFLGFTSYDSNWKLDVAFKQDAVVNNLGCVLSANGKKQLRVAETEKYAHVTFFFNSQVEKPEKGEERVLVDSPKVLSYDLKPEMSAYKVTDKLLERIGKYDFIAVNYANSDLVGHSGVFEAVKKACEVVDECVGKVVKKALFEGYVVLIGGDHGNADHMYYDNGEVDPSHGFNPVQYSLVSEEYKGRKLKSAGLKDIAPTILEIMGIQKPKEMTGESLLL